MSDANGGDFQLGGEAGGGERKIEFSRNAGLARGMRHLFGDHKGQVKNTPKFGGAQGTGQKYP